MKNKIPQSDKVRSWCKESIRTGAALREIRDDQLYRHEYPTFEAFCKGEGLTLSEASDLIAAAETIERLERESIRLEGCNEPLEEIATPTSASAA